MIHICQYLVKMLTWQNSIPTKKKGNNKRRTRGFSYKHKLLSIESSWSWVFSSIKLLIVRLLKRNKISIPKDLMSFVIKLFARNVVEKCEPACPWWNSDWLTNKIWSHSGFVKNFEGTAPTVKLWMTCNEGRHAFKQL